MPMNEDTLLGRLQELGPFADRSEARRAFDATLLAMRRGLSDDEADWLAVALGPNLAAPLLRERYSEELTPDELYRWTKRHSKTRKSAAVEHAQVVCRTLTELLRPAELERLRRHVPGLVSLFSVPDPSQSASRRLRGVPSEPDMAGSIQPSNEVADVEREAGHRPDLARTQKVFISGAEPRGEAENDEAHGDDRSVANARHAGRR